MAASQPNILWICTDQQRFDTLGCTGNPFVRTPNLDRLAAEGMLFRNAFCQNPVCTPSRASFLTGRYPRTTRCRQNGQCIPADETLVPRILRDAGYVCGLSGKLHLSVCNPSACPGTERRIDDGYDTFLWSHHPGADWPTNDYARWLGDQGREPGSTPSDVSRHVRFGPEEPLGQTAWCFEQAMSFIRSNASSRFPKPWLFSVNCFDPHHPFDPPAEAFDRFRDVLEEIPLPNYVPGELRNKPVWQRTDHEGAYGGKGGYPYDGMSDADHRAVRAAYWAMVEVIDRYVGRILDYLTESGQRDNTLIIFMSDHGEMLGDHGIYLKGPYFYDCAVRVPLIIAGPGIPAGRESSALVELVDVAETVLDACGLPRHPGMQGRSLLPMLRGECSPDRHRDDVYCEFYGSNFHYEPTAQTTMVRTESWKLTVAHGLGTGELYDLRNDPDETVNLWDDPGSAAVRGEMLVRLADRMAWTADPLPRRLAVW